MFFLLSHFPEEGDLIEHMKILYHCRICREPIRDGDTAYLICGAFCCTGCVESSLIIARPPEERPSFRYPRHGSTIVGFPAGIPRKSNGIK